MSIPPILQPGSVIGGYTIVRVLGSGGMGQVFLARHPRLPRHAAVKVLFPHLAGDDSFRARFEREANLASQLDHPNIVAVHDCGIDNGIMWLSMQFVDGTDAARLIKQSANGLDADQAMNILRQAGQGLDHAHSLGMIHRDIKPANLLVTGNWDGREGSQRVLVSDFGIARTTSNTTGLTQSGSLVATLSYAAPEVLMSSPNIDHRADIYALGCTMHVLLTGSVPFPSSDISAVITAHLTQPPPSLTALRPELSIGLDAVIATALAKKPADRYPTCHDFVEAARAALIMKSAPLTEVHLRRPTRPPSDEPDTALGIPAPSPFAAHSPDPSRPWPPPPPDIRPAASAAPEPKKPQILAEVPSTPDQVDPPSRRGRIAVAILVPLCIAVLVVAWFVARRSTTEESSSSEPPAAAQSTVTPPIGGVMNIWLVGGPDEPAPEPVLPQKFEAILAGQNVTPHVASKSAAEFAQAFADARARNEAPEIIGGVNFLPFESLQNQGRLVAANGPLEEVNESYGFAFLAKDAPRYEDAVALAMVDDSCGPTDGAPTKTSLDPAASKVANDATRAMLSGDADKFKDLLSTRSIQYLPNEKAEVQDVRVCRAVGNDRSGVVYLAATSASDTSAGRTNIAVILIGEAGGWRVLSATQGWEVFWRGYFSHDPHRDYPGNGQIIDAFDAVSQAPTATPNVTFESMSPADGQFPGTIDRRNYDYFVAEPAGDVGRILIQLFEFSYENPTGEAWEVAQDSRFIAGALAISNGTVKWRSVCLLDDGTLVFSETRHWVE